MSYMKNKLPRVIVMTLFLLVVFAPASIRTQPLGEKDGITILYQFTVGDPDNVEESVMIPMYYHEGRSIFVRSAQEKSMDFDGENLSSMEIMIRPGTTDGQAYFVDRKNKKITAQEPVLDEVVNMEEEIPQFEWRIMGEQKTIAEHACFGATTSFRGRSYSVWFTPDIPLDVGPWKFSGLPGAILQVNDKEGRFNWYCKLISSLSAENKVLIQMPEKRKTYGFDEFQKMSIKKTMDYLQKWIGKTELTIESELDTSNSLERPIK
jgi:GLPGLI family protein